MYSRKKCSLLNMLYLNLPSVQNVTICDSAVAKCFSEQIDSGLDQFFFDFDDNCNIIELWGAVIRQLQ